MSKTDAILNDMMAIRRNKSEKREEINLINKVVTGPLFQMINEPYQDGP